MNVILLKCFYGGIKFRIIDCKHFILFLLTSLVFSACKPEEVNLSMKEGGTLTLGLILLINENNDELVLYHNWY
jgi:hypothetical protein